MMQLFSLAKRNNSKGFNFKKFEPSFGPIESEDSMKKSIKELIDKKAISLMYQFRDDNPVEPYEHKNIRNFEGMIILSGSYNPLHEGHTQLTKAVQSIKNLRIKENWRAS